MVKMVLVIEESSVLRVKNWKFGGRYVIVLERFLVVVMRKLVVGVKERYVKCYKSLVKRKVLRVDMNKVISKGGKKISENVGL